MIETFERHDLDGEHALYSGRLPERLRLDAAGFKALWSLHPDEPHVVMMYGRLVNTPRWQQAFGRDYFYTGNLNSAAPVPPLLEPFLAWTREAVDPRLNGLLLNWYDGELGHYIGPHHDYGKGLVPTGPIVTISFGEQRIFRLSLPKSRERRDFEASDGAVFVMPHDTNLVWKHEVPKSARSRGRRVSVTVRAFEDRP